MKMYYAKDCDVLYIPNKQNKFSMYCKDYNGKWVIIGNRQVINKYEYYEIDLQNYKPKNYTHKEIENLLPVELQL